MFSMNFTSTWYKYYYFLFKKRRNRTRDTDTCWDDSEILTVCDGTNRWPEL